MVLALVCFGLVMVFSTSSATALLNDGDPLGLAIRQAAYALVGLGAYAVMVRMQPETMRRLGPVGARRLGASCCWWCSCRRSAARSTARAAGSRSAGLGNLQPSELAKVALALWMAQAVVRAPGRLRTPAGLVPVPRRHGRARRC